MTLKEDYDTFGGVLIRTGRITGEAKTAAEDSKEIFGHAGFSSVHKCTTRYSGEVLRESVPYTDRPPCGRRSGAVRSPGIRTVVSGVSYEKFRMPTLSVCLPGDREGVLKQPAIRIQLMGPVLEEGGMPVFEYGDGERRPAKDLI